MSQLSMPRQQESPPGWVGGGSLQEDRHSGGTPLECSLEWEYRGQLRVLEGQSVELQQTAADPIGVRSSWEDAHSRGTLQPLTPPEHPKGNRVDLVLTLLTLFYSWNPPEGIRVTRAG